MPATSLAVWLDTVWQEVSQGSSARADDFLFLLRPTKTVITIQTVTDTISSSAIPPMIPPTEGSIWTLLLDSSSMVVNSISVGSGPEIEVVCRGIVVIFESARYEVCSGSDSKLVVPRAGLEALCGSSGTKVCSAGGIDVSSTGVSVVVTCSGRVGSVPVIDSTTVDGVTSDGCRKEVCRVCIPRTVDADVGSAVLCVREELC